MLIGSVGLTARKYLDLHPKDTQRRSRIWMKKQTTWRVKRYQAKEGPVVFLNLGFALINESEMADSQKLARVYEWGAVVGGEVHISLVS